MNNAIVEDTDLITHLRETIAHTIKKTLPSLGIYGDRVFGQGSHFTFHFDIHGYNRQLKGSPYYLNDHETDKIELLHYTSIKNLFSIIREKSLRLYCLQNSKDITEYEFASKLFKVSNAHSFAKNKRQNIFILSMTHPKNINSEYHWREFANDNKGVAIKFTLEGNEKWQNYFLSKVDYHSINYFEETFALCEKINKENTYQVGFELSIISDLLAFHKREPYEKEYEYRLIYNGKNNGEYRGGDNEMTFADANSEGEIVQFYKLPLNIRGEQKPKITISEVIIGSRVSEYSNTVSTLRHEFIINDLNVPIFSPSPLAL